MNTPELESRLQASGLHLRGLLEITDEDNSSLQLGIAEGTWIVLVGNIGSSYWPVFTRSPEYQDGLAHPLDRWSRRIGGCIAGEFGAQVVFPFEGPPYYPFQQWAARAESLKPSIMGLMIHPRYGLWHSYRFGLLMPAVAGLPKQQSFEQASPCESCVARACLTTCPVGAFDVKGYDVDVCSGHLKKSPTARCHSEGCLARSSCPVGIEYQYDFEEHRFHLGAFLASRQAAD